MGNCGSTEETKVENESNPQSAPSYLKAITLQVAERNDIGKIVGRNALNFEATTPINQKHDVFNVGKAVKVFGTVLPGLDPYGGEKKCQDNYSYTFLDDMLLCGLFDGHGPVGEQVSAFSASYIQDYFKKNLENFKENPKESLTQMLEQCDEDLKSTDIKSELSGTTACIILLTKTLIHTACLGDSRAILATASEITPELPPPANKFCRHWPVLRKIKAIALTNDQKPNHEEEYLRIRQAGGRVEKMADVMGNTMGPYRVWEANSDKPGLAMSRSIGDGVAKKVGVIATPVYHNFTLYPESDLYIIMASDGVWDVMENQEVVNFVEKFRECCEISGLTSEFPALPQNSSISRLVCEEARFRWYGLIEAEDVNIDDISCIVVDISSNMQDFRSSKHVRKVQMFQSIAVPSESQGQGT
jgi:serine/threonine protein phosphatase PrpC